eukprot:112037_1
MNVLTSALQSLNILSAENDNEEKSVEKNEKENRPHIYFVIDTTGSMSSYISSLNHVLDQIFRMIKILFAGKVYLHIISYKDYCDKKVIEQFHSTTKIQAWVKTHLKASGGGDEPEAAKTALNLLYKRITKSGTRMDSKSIVFVYTDAPPHHPSVGSNKDNIRKEKAEIKKKYGPSTTCPGFDWIEICKAFRRIELPIYTFIARARPHRTKAFWKLLGEVIEMPNTNVDTITTATIGCLNQLMDSNDENFITKYAQNFKVLKHDKQVDLLNDKSIKNETNCQGLLPGSGTTLRPLCPADFMTLKSLNFMSNVLQNLPKKLLHDTEFRDLVFAEFTSIFTKENVLCLSYNSVFGSIWRYLCRFREDDRLKVLKNTLSLIIMQLTEDKRKEMQEWLDESYDDTEEINDIIKKHLDSLEEKEEVEYITLDAIDAIKSDLLPTKKELLTIAHSLYGDIIYKVQNIMTHLIMMKQKGNEPPPFDDKVINSYIAIPYSLNNKRFFSLLSHLVIPGTMFTLRPTLIMSMIAYLSGNVILKERAKEILLENKGKWITLDKLEDFPEFISVPFVKLVVRCNKAMEHMLLTDDEAVFYNKLYKIYRVRLTRPKLFDVKIGFTPKLANINHDFKKKCGGCGEFRSFTLMLEGDTCALCTLKESGNLQTQERIYPFLDGYDEVQGEVCKEYDDLKDKSSKSHLVSCRTCHAIYAVIDVAALNVNPKCHYCRSMVPHHNIPVIHCNMCLNRWIVPNKNYFNTEDKTWTCPCCSKAPHNAVVTVKASFEQLVDVYPILLSRLLNMNDKKEIVKDLFSPMSLYKVYMKHKDNDLWLTDEKEQNMNAVVDRLVNDQATYEGKRIHNIAPFVESIVKSVHYGKLSDICCLCFDEKQLILLESACGLCKNLMCFECLNTWYNQLKPGHIVLPSHLLCALCKQKPNIKTMKKYNKDICTIIGGKKTKAKELSPAHYYGWCVGCYEIKPAMKRECLRETLPNMNDFKCEECVEKELIQATLVQDKDANYVKSTYPQCPGCQMPTVKISGCNHITCNCGSHWCYECGEAFGPDYIYDHMAEEHGY